MSVQIDVSNIHFGINSLKNKQSQATNNISLGLNACGGSSTGTSGIENISIGKNSMNVLLSGSYNIGIGSNALGATTTLSNNIGIGNSAGYSNVGGNSIAIGFQAGQTSQSGNSIAIGFQAGKTSQGINSIAIGLQAGVTNQANNSIVINSSGSTLENTTASSLKIKPIRDAVVASNTKVLLYNTSTNEVHTDISNILAVSSSGNVGIGTTTPLTTLDVSGTINTNSFYSLTYTTLPTITTTQIGYTIRASLTAGGSVTANTYYLVGTFTSVPIGVWLCIGTSGMGGNTGYTFVVGVTNSLTPSSFLTNNSCTLYAGSTWASYSYCFSVNNSTSQNLYIMVYSSSASTNWNSNYGSATLMRIA